MKLFKKILVLAAAVSMLALSGCSDGSDDDEKTTDTWSVTKECTWTDEAVEVATAEDLADVEATLKIKTTDIGGSTTGDWWFWADTDGSSGDSVAWESGSGKDCIYTITITDSTKLSYLKNNGLWMKGAPGLTSKVILSK